MYYENVCSKANYFPLKVSKFPMRVLKKSKDDPSVIKI